LLIYVATIDALAKPAGLGRDDPNQVNNTILTLLLLFFAHKMLI
jgi:hypothetical protein